MEYEFCKPRTEDDYEAFYQMLDAAFPDEDVRAITRRFVEEHSEMTDENYFMVKKGEEVAAGLLLLPQKWVIDGVEIKVAEMGCVGTRPEYRRKRLQWILNEKFDEYARENGYDLCVLAGIPYFYRQFGYQYAVDLDIATTIERDKIPVQESKLYRRDIVDADIPMMDELLRKTQDRYMVKSIRTEGVWRMQHGTSTYGGDGFKGSALTRDEKLVGYYRYVEDEKNSTLYIRELCHSIEASENEVLATLSKHAEEKVLDKIRTAMAHVDPISVYLRELGGKVNKPYAWQIKALDLFRLMEKLRPAFEKRIAESSFNGLSKALQFNFFKFAVRMEIVDGVIKSMEKYYNEEKRVLAFNPYAFIQLIMGYKSREEITAAYPDFWVRDDHIELVDVLFPKGPGYIHYAY
jgi:predicted acetyltransferase